MVFKNYIKCGCIYQKLLEGQWNLSKIIFWISFSRLNEALLSSILEQRTRIGTELYSSIYLFGIGTEPLKLWSRTNYSGSVPPVLHTPCRKKWQFYYGTVHMQWIVLVQFKYFESILIIQTVYIVNLIENFNTVKN